MGIVIEDMDLPKSCRECMFRSGAGRKRLSCSLMAMDCDISGERPDWCPMREYKPRTAQAVPQRMEFRWRS